MMDHFNKAAAAKGDAMGLGSDAWSSAQWGPDARLAKALSGKKPSLAANYRGLYGKTPIMLAAGSNQLPRMRMLLDAGARLDEQDDAGNTALGWACRCGAPDAVRFLLSHGADPTGGSICPLIAAAMAQSVACVQAFEEFGAGPTTPSAASDALFEAWESAEAVAARKKNGSDDNEKFVQAMASWKERRQLAQASLAPRPAPSKRNSL
jgi:hypothetical protein